MLMQLEGEATARAIRLARFVNTPLYVVHVMSIDAMDEIAQARKSGNRITLRCISLVWQVHFRVMQLRFILQVQIFWAYKKVVNLKK